jgi:AAA domain, putative AbiEii toxin, Type IV TA system
LAKESEHQMSVLLDGFAFAGFRSFPHGKIQRFGPLGQLNVIVGPNNAGKSNVLRVIRALVPVFPNLGFQDQQMLFRPDFLGGFGPLDWPTGTQEVFTSLGFGLVPGRERWNKFVELGAARQSLSVTDVTKSAVELYGIDGMIWIDAERPNNGGSVTFSQMVQKSVERFDQATRNSSDQGGRVPEALSTFAWEPNHDAPETNRAERLVMGVLSHAIPGTTIPVAFIGASRGLDPNRRNVEGFGDLVVWLRAHQNPPYLERDLKLPKFLALNDFVSSVLEVAAELHVPVDGNEIEVTMNGRTLPITELGSGVEQTIYLALRCTQASQTLVLIEEPETHLHPHLLLQLTRYLLEKTDNQYVVTTHSAALLDHPGATLFSVTMEDGWSGLHTLRLARERHDALHAIGYRPSDLVHANCVIWVEGPSDRIYVKWWLACADPSLVEGIDFQIMFYGGRLLSHLTVTDKSSNENSSREVTDFIELQQLNRKFAIIIDSDRTKPGAAINNTKLRLKAACEEQGGTVWVTTGREVENYLDSSALRSVVNHLHPSKPLPMKWTAYTSFRPTKGNYDKIAVARLLTSTPPDPEQLNQLDLSARINQLIEFIRSARRPAGDVVLEVR